ncbi:UDP-N-acetylmuramate dehydrogenase [Microbacterium imperiale]|uniref:UDP-N-acetylenolpyruvoylglucosamine reductase n=1 Tax=Microbacterium imperiale TaxID=33884 RepID=A0A9W6HIB4_9MICO|nr:UDP-N-acetylmuramate dehydrogenase [Microbacterium imperiale]MBP2421756.1 UDP-N-acetylmuramate dehydrogenase [Microbacterium imperiale]MDS0199143.1 UDP-N-acetylmuramate dehydrogenase [Microbacterium imperiale]BFE39059.1 UDP-N-acetylmuramate dehydrogenase [Microbacterium imperiale]BFE42099.1 UDP-N-acetylmuramate dehydrogenase [Microbacterium imperiale]GLJ81050.1 UDP-N-acetylenolpyruvoylglucosamine reductase [Microbacterium imperiale]
MAEVAPRPLAELTTLRAGAVPARMVEAHTTDELVAVLRELWADGEPWLVVGGGSNLLVGDDPFDGTVVVVRTSGIEELPSPNPGHTRLRVQAGHSWDDLVEYAVAAGLSGIAAMSGIPGTAGAAPVQNIGAYGQEVVQTLVEVELLDEATGEVSVVPASELGLGFRTSVLKHHHGSVAARPAVILSITLELAQVGHGEFAVRGPQLRGALGLDPDATVTLRWVRETVLAVRASKGMVLDDADPDTWSAGSFFQNAVVTAAFARSLPPECPRWPVAPDPVADRIIPLNEYYGVDPTDEVAEPHVKVSAAWLIEHAGIGKGFALPGSRAGLSTKHALALTNRGGASAEQLAALARFVQQRVQSEFGLILQPEPVLVGVDL